MKASARYAKIVEWSAEDNCYVGSAPGLILGGCHGDGEQAVFEELCQIVDEAIALYEKDGRPLPPRRRWREHHRRVTFLTPPIHTQKVHSPTPRLPEKEHARSL